MGNLCCRRVAYNTYSPTAYICSNRSKKAVPLPSESKVSAPTEVGPAMTSYHSGDDCAINELLEGRMELEVILPDGRPVRLTVERRTPMMDLLVQATTANKISPGGHVIHIWTERGKDFVHYKPSTPIGSLDTNTIYIVPKKDVINPPVKRMPKLANQPFEPTFRLQVHLPRNQLMVLRVSPKLTISELREMVCEDKNLDSGRYQLVHPNHLSQTLDGATTLAAYGSTEISLLSNTSIQANICQSTTDIISYSSRDEDKKKKGILGLISKIAVGSRSTSSDELDSPSDVGVKRDNQTTPAGVKSTLKKRPAPPPPSGPPSVPAKKTTGQLSLPSLKKPTVPTPSENSIAPASTHSRHSSDSSGYHEASIFDESPEHSAPETSSGSSGVSSLEGVLYNSEASTDTKANNSNASKKRKAPLPPSRSKSKGEAPPVPKHCQDIVVGRVSVSYTASESEVVPSALQGLESSKVPSEGKDQGSTDSSKRDGVLQKTSCSVNASKNDIDEHVFLPNTETRPEDEELHRGTSESSSIATIEDVQDSFNEAIAEAQKIVDEEDENKKTKTTEAPGGDQAQCASDNKPVTKLALATLNALIEQDVTQQEIASHIEAAFCTIEEPHSRTTLPNLSSQSLAADDGWRYHIPSPPPSIAGHCSATPTPFLLAIKERRPFDVKRSGKEDSDRNLSRKPTRPDKKTLGKGSPEKELGNCVKPRLNNFSIGSYLEQTSGDKQLPSILLGLEVPEEKIVPGLPFNYQTSEKFSRRLFKSESFCSLDAGKPEDVRKGKYGGPGIRIRSFADRNNKLRPNDNKVYGVEGSVRGIKGQVRQRCSELFHWKVDAPSLSGRSSSLLDLSSATPEKKAQPNKESNASVTSTCDTNLKRSLSAQSLDQRSDFIAEQERLQQEYLKLQTQFLLWQKQLLTNHAVLQEERIMPSSSLPAMPVRTLRQSQSLPNGVPETPTPSSPEPETFEESSLPGVNSFVLRSLSYEPRESRSTTLPRVAMNIPILDMNGMQVKSGTSTLRSSTNKTHFKPPQMRPSTKNRQRLPPEVRREDDSGSDLMTRLREEFKPSPVVLPSKFSAKSLIEEHPSAGKLQAIFQNGAREQCEKSQANKSLAGKAVVNGHSNARDQQTNFVKKPLANGHSFDSGAKPFGKSSVGPDISTKSFPVNGSPVVENKPIPYLESVKKVPKVLHANSSDSIELKDKASVLQWQTECNGASSPTGYKNSSSLSIPISDGLAVKNHPPPPPPPLVSHPVKTTSSSVVQSLKPAAVGKKYLDKKTIDPREELMLEIRNFGGRRALKKTSSDSPNWSTTIYNTASVISA